MILDEIYAIKRRQKLIFKRTRFVNYDGIIILSVAWGRSVFETVFVYDKYSSKGDNLISTETLSITCYNIHARHDK